MLGNRSDLQIGNGVTGWDMLMLVVQNVLTVSLDIYKPRCQIFVIPHVIRLLYKDYAHIP